MVLTCVPNVQATPFASAFRPVVPTRRDAATPASFVPPAHSSMGPFQTSPGPSRGTSGQGPYLTARLQTSQGPVLPPPPTQGSPGQAPQPEGAPQGPFQTSSGPSRGSFPQDPPAAKAPPGGPSSSHADGSARLPAIPSVPSSQPSSTTHVPVLSSQKGNMSGSDSAESQGMPVQAGAPLAQVRQASPQVP